MKVKEKEAKVKFSMRKKSCVVQEKYISLNGKKKFMYFLKLWGVYSRFRFNPEIKPRKTNGFKTAETAVLLHAKQGEKNSMMCINMSGSKTLNLNESVSPFLQTFRKIHQKRFESGASTCCFSSQDVFFDILEYHVTLPATQVKEPQLTKAR